MAFLILLRIASKGTSLASYPLFALWSLFRTRALCRFYFVVLLSRFVIQLTLSRWSDSTILVGDRRMNWNCVSSRARTNRHTFVMAFYSRQQHLNGGGDGDAMSTECCLSRSSDFNCGVARPPTISFIQLSPSHDDVARCSSPPKSVRGKVVLLLLLILVLLLLFLDSSAGWCNSLLFDNRRYTKCNCEKIVTFTDARRTFWIISPSLGVSVRLRRHFFLVQNVELRGRINEFYSDSELWLIV